MRLEIYDVKDRGDKLIFKLEYDNEFRVAIGKVLNIPNPSKRDIQNYILKSLENSINFNDFDS